MDRSKKNNLRIGVVGATGMVGQTFMKILEEKNISFSEMRPFASENSAGKLLKCQGQSWPIQSLRENCFNNLDVVFFSSGDDISKQWAPKAAAAGAYAIDNSAAFRMDPHTSLIVPEVNFRSLINPQKPQIIANPNCSTIQLVVALKPLLDQFGLDEVRVSSYQAVSGGGQAAYDELLDQVKDYKNPNHKNVFFPHPIFSNLIPQIGSFNDFGFCTEEIKIMNETRKILNHPTLKISAFTVRVPVLNAHSEVVWARLQKEVDKPTMTAALAKAPGIVVIDDPKNSQYPTPLFVSGKDPVYVGRIHRDIEDPRLWMMWVVSDNVRKGAALNGLQIMQSLWG